MSKKEKKRQRQQKATETPVNVEGGKPNDVYDIIFTSPEENFDVSDLFKEASVSQGVCPTADNESLKLTPRLIYQEIR